MEQMLRKRVRYLALFAAFGLPHWTIVFEPPPEIVNSANTRTRLMIISILFKIYLIFIRREGFLTIVLMLDRQVGMGKYLLN